MNEVYYRIITSSDNENLLNIVEMQWFDENDYDQSRFLREKNGNEILKFDTEAAAIEFMDRYIKPEYINPEYKKFSSDRFYKD